MCDRNVCPNAHVSPTHIVPEHVYGIAIMFILEVRPRNMFGHLGLRYAPPPLFQCH